MIIAGACFVTINISILRTHLMKTLRGNVVIIMMVFLMTISLASFFSFYKINSESFKGYDLQVRSLILKLDGVLDKSQSAAVKTSALIGRSCDDNVLTSLREVSAVTPYVRSINLIKDDELYCSSVISNRKIKIDRDEVLRDSLVLLKGNMVTPDTPIVLYSLTDPHHNAVVVVTDSFYLSGMLPVADSNFRVFMRIGDRYLGEDGHLHSQQSYENSGEYFSSKYHYSLVFEFNKPLTFYGFIIQSWVYLLVAFLCSSVISFLLLQYLSYRRTLDHMLKVAIKKKQLRPYIQEICRGDGEIAGGEVLIRWEHPEFGFIKPDEFIPVAERTGLIKKITAVCFNDVVEAFRKNAGVIPKGLFINFNVSSLDFNDSDLLHLCVFFQTELKSADVELVLEITERELIDNSAPTTELINQIENSGVKFALDDFGTGYANYLYLKQFHASFLKIDKAFTTDVCINDMSSMVIKNMLNLADRFDCSVIAEGVETATQLNCLENLGVEFFQGYYFRKPVTVDDYIDLLACRMKR